MCDGKHSSKRDVVILSIKPKRPDFPSSQKAVPVSELLQEWDKLDAYYRGQLLKLTKSLNKNKQKQNSRHSSPAKVASKQQHHQNSCNKNPHPVNNKKYSSLSSDQFTELFGDENHFSPPADTNNNSRCNKNKLLHSRSLNSLFDEDSDAPPSLPPPSSRSRKSSLTNVNGNLVVSIPVLSVQEDNYGKRRGSNKWLSDDEDSGGSTDEDDEDEAIEEPENFLSVPRDNFQVQYGTKQKTRVTLLETGGKGSPRWIVPIRVAPYKPPTAQGLNGVQIQKILYHKNDSINYASPTTTSARTPDKPPDNQKSPASALTGTIIKSIKIAESPASTVSPRSSSSSGLSTGTRTPTPTGENNNATPKQTASKTPELSSPREHGPKSTGSIMSTVKLSSPPVNSTTERKLKRPISDNQAGAPNSGNSQPVSGPKKRRFADNAAASIVDNSASHFMPVSSTSSTYSFQTSSGGKGDNSDNDQGSRTSASGMDSSGELSSSAKKQKNQPSFMKPSSQSSSSTVASSGGGSIGDSTGAVFLSPAAVSITDRIIKKANRLQPELLERQRRRRLESNQRKSYAMQKGDEHEERESIDLSMKSFEMIWNVPLLSPLRSP